MFKLLLVMIGGAAGSALRYEVGRMSLRLWGASFPWGTLAVNLVGGLLMGILAGIVVRHGPNEPLHLLFGVGLLGGFTTFSTFALDGYVLLQRGDLGIALAYALVSVVGSIFLLVAGLWITKSLI